MLKIITDVSAELITVAEAAEFMRVDDNGDSPATYPDEDVIEASITAARQWVEEYLRRQIGIKTLELTLDKFPRYGDKSIYLPPPLITTSPIISVKYTDANNDEQTLVVDEDYYLSQDAEPAVLRPVDGVWPSDELNSASAVRIRFQAGYSNAESPQLSPVLPKTIRQAILMQVSDLYHNRESQVERPLSANQTLERLLSMYRLEMGI